MGERIYLLTHLLIYLLTYLKLKDELLKKQKRRTTTTTVMMMMMTLCDDLACLQQLTVASFSLTQHIEIKENQT